MPEPTTVARSSAVPKPSETSRLAKPMEGREAGRRAAGAVEGRLSLRKRLAELFSHGFTHMGFFTSQQPKYFIRRLAQASAVVIVKAT